MRLLVMLIAIVLVAAPLPALAEDYDAEIRDLAGLPQVARAFAEIDDLESRGERDLVELTEIAAPPFQEAARARRFAELLSEAGLAEVAIDQEGNVLGRRRGFQGGGAVALVAHLDTVFPPGTDVTVRRQGARFMAPGVGDNSRGLVVLLTLVRAVERAGIGTRRDLLFVGSVGEEGLGDLRGVKHLLRAGHDIDALIAIDGSSIARVVNGAVGSRRYRVTFRGPGGHSWGAFGLGNPAHALARAIHLFDEDARVFVQSGPRSSYNVGRIGGGTSVNAIPAEAWAEVDLRCEDEGQLLALDALLHDAVARALVEQRSVASRGDPLAADLRLIGDRPSGRTPPDAPLVQRALAAARYFGMDPELTSGSTDANVAIAHGVPAVTIGRGGRGGGAHSVDEWWSNVDGARAIKNALLVSLASAGVVPSGARP